jgi:hypothetical protein
MLGLFFSTCTFWTNAQLALFGQKTQQQHGCGEPMNGKQYAGRMQGMCGALFCSNMGIVGRNATSFPLNATRFNGNKTNVIMIRFIL